MTQGNEKYPDPQIVGMFRRTEAYRQPFSPYNCFEAGVLAERARNSERERALVELLDQAFPTMFLGCNDSWVEDYNRIVGGK